MKNRSIFWLCLEGGRGLVYRNTLNDYHLKDIPYRLKEFNPQQQTTYPLYIHFQSTFTSTVLNGTDMSRNSDQAFNLTRYELEQFQRARRFKTERRASSWSLKESMRPRQYRFSSTLSPEAQFAMKLASEEKYQKNRAQSSKKFLPPLKSPNYSGDRSNQTEQNEFIKVLQCDCEDDSSSVFDDVAIDEIARQNSSFVQNTKHCEDEG